MSNDRIQKLERQLAVQAEAAFVARKLLGEALAKLNPELAVGNFGLFVEESSWQAAPDSGRKQVFETLHLGRHNAIRSNDMAAKAAFEAAIAELREK